MADRVVLHIGAMKSGTSFVQNVLQANPARLAEQGVLFPGRRWSHQVRGVLELAEAGGRNQPPLKPDGPWREIAAQVNDTPGTSLISMEFLAARNKEKIALIQDSFPGTPIEAVLTARDLARNIPAMWQESVQNAATSHWTEFLDSVRREERPPSPGGWFWRHQGIAAIARRWSRAIGKDRFTLVTVPHRGAPAGLLWQRFGEAAGLDPAGFDLQVRANPSIGAASAVVLRELNERLDARSMKRRRYHVYVKHALAKRGLSRRARGEPTLGLDAAWAMERGTEEVRRLRGLGLRVVGDLDELLPRPVPGVAAEDVTLEQREAAAMDALEYVVRAWSSGKKPLNPED